jgi:rubrerythrin
MDEGVRRLREDNEQRCERLVARSGLLDTEGIDWDEVPAHALDGGAVDCLIYMRDVEGFTNRDLVGLSGHPATLADPLVRRFLSAWRAEEAEHARVLDRFLRTYCSGRGLALAAEQPPPPAVASPVERALVALTRPVGHVVTVAHMVWGATNELLTMTGYRLLARRCGNPVLAELLRRVAAQEARHYSFYLLQAEWRLADSPLARAVVPRLVRRTWTPVGVGADYKSRAEFDRVLAYLGSAEGGNRAVTSMDRTLSRLPGFGSLGIYSAAAGRAAAAA